MEIIVADVYGFCGGVKRAVKMAFDNADKGVYSYGDLVHNEFVVDELQRKGVEEIDDTNIENSKVIIRSHGVHKNILDDLKKRNNEIINCVCPKVENIYNIVDNFYEKGYNIVIIGNNRHPEVIGINSRCNDSATIISSLKDIKIPDGKIVVVSQTTSNVDFFENAINVIKDISKDEVLVYNTICNATFKRQESVRNLSKKVDAIIVLGGKKSSNTKKLAEIAKLNCKNVFLIESINDIDLNIFKKFNKIGITAGASTPDSVIKEAVSRMENFDKGEMMEAIDNSFKRIRKGEVVTGEVLYITDSEVMVNLGYRSDGIISKDELAGGPDVNPQDLYEQGQEIEVYVLKMDDGDGNVVLSTKRVADMKVWDEVEELYNNKENITVTVKNQVKGGLTADYNGLNAFIPASHVSVRFQKDLSKFIGEEFETEIIDFDKRKKRIVLSRKNVLQEELDRVRDEVYENLHEGDVIEGTVQRLTNFGAFVDVGGVDGLIHISELSWNRVKHPQDVVSPGDVVNVQVLNVDKEKNRIALGLKQTMEKPWDVFTKEVKVGDVVKGKVVNLLDFGAFVRLEQGVDGLLHVSQISREHVEKPQDKLSIGEEVTVKVTDIDEENQKISLSIKALIEPEEKEKEESKPKERKPRRERKAPKREKRIEEPKQDDFNMTIGEMLGLNFSDANLDSEIIADEKEISYSEEKEESEEDTEE
ncbi:MULTISPECIES: bifunctional 4-hydroxy-3-methylbut-2-enyl diphosphate reductase/30S ribosomal protein S1 [Peptoniphilus]|uniref:bifunctional 4-hydroxy-3-methylbut-2-enyl diphosphate reductase/30S ribosomal protein S1 n=1 Tax=Peptoniphilus TaxID=162289 RepID=UPI0008DA6986|nr:MULTISPECIES: bifunctional 4-hydroxy-3-methylbut-2-enyl diphosphate reductase/30S ribosomal protein S1 [Peptoniphilus]MBS6610113.1 bifunctional 4-hydroxy-3-methylbut-2-enyl diphosphate reductase/30S ribosomal protein S1 [Peptoniphilus harei]MDU1043397.1 bifunctional 4-hydroxy-3-methylbut-2-enyl diphosphate reductase/30S ribosomal protein S1 [Peptoniphilus rhinitidis]MDU1954113.1 bifunctional 4-hydroxy-3-methylbut-2-enyl diphosphate reductase/30S ribosomal protein S1 [Peptoniphilus lacydonensi